MTVHGPSLGRLVLDRYLLLPIGAALALVWANVAAESYFGFAHALAFPVNEIGMALFLALVTQEAFEALMPGGALHTWRRWALPLIGAAGGALGAAFVYIAYVYARHEEVLLQAWPIGCAIDIAAAYYMVKVVLRRSAALPFVLLLAIATDAAGLVVLALWAPLTPGHIAGAALLLAAIVIAAGLRKGGVRAFWPYLAIAGPLSWSGFYVAGVHPALALVPIVPFLPHEPRSLDLLADASDDDEVHHVEHEWHEAVQIVLFFFGLVNAGIALRGYDTGTWAVLLAALVGRPLGILAAIALALAAGLHLPPRIGWRHLIVVAVAASSGFTVALFFASSLLPVGAVLQQVALGAVATIAGAPLTLGAAWLLHVGRLRRSHGGKHHAVRLQARPVH